MENQEHLLNTIGPMYMDQLIKQKKAAMIDENGVPLLEQPSLS
jgi:hypothetical protein